ncbi:hypothetical protein ACFTWD_04685 [Streptomyces sp. NPDC056943]|uniref:hypothetical protein n=1 Tax=Streptomyces sp. NPDC056943 TaxID=3345971 RepID=UPI0036426ABC
MGRRSPANDADEDKAGYAGPSRHGVRRWWVRFATAADNDLIATTTTAMAAPGLGRRAALAAENGTARLPPHGPEPTGAGQGA